MEKVEEKEGGRGFSGVGTDELSYEHLAGALEEGALLQGAREHLRYHPRLHLRRQVVQEPLLEVCRRVRVPELEVVQYLIPEIRGDPISGRELHHGGDPRVSLRVQDGHSVPASA